jgi:hypothetical protein
MDYEPVCLGEEPLDDPFVLAEGDPASFDQLVRLFDAGSAEASVGHFQLLTRTRESCHPITGCSPWTDQPAELTYTGSPAPLPTGGELELILWQGRMWLYATGNTPDPTLQFRCELFDGSGPWVDCESGWTWAAGPPRFKRGGDNTRELVRLQGRVYADGTVHFVSEPGPEALVQVAFIGELD